MTDEEPLAAVVDRADVQTTIAALRGEGVYDADRHVRPVDDDGVAIPVTSAPTETAVRRVVRGSAERRHRTLEDYLEARGWTDGELAAAPSSWAQLGTVVQVSMSDVPRPDEVGEALLALHGGADTVVATGPITGPHRTPDVTVLAGEGDTETVHVEHGTTYAMDLAEVMFSPGNKAERRRMGEVVSTGERVLDAFAGIGYFALPMARAGATVTAIEHNPVAFAYLLENAVRNDVTDRLEAYRADCRAVLEARPAGRFDRAVLGYYEAHEYLDAVLPRLDTGGTVHMHEATPEALVPDRPVERLEAAAGDVDRAVTVAGVRDVKGYSEGVRHVVVDATVGG